MEVDKIRMALLVAFVNKRNLERQLAETEKNIEGLLNQLAAYEQVEAAAQKTEKDGAAAQTVSADGASAGSKVPVYDEGKGVRSGQENGAKRLSAKSS